MHQVRRWRGCLRAPWCICVGGLRLNGGKCCYFICFIVCCPGGWMVVDILQINTSTCGGAAAGEDRRVCTSIPYLKPQFIKLPTLNRTQGPLAMSPLQNDAHRPLARWFISIYIYLLAIRDKTFHHLKKKKERKRKTGLSLQIIRGWYPYRRKKLWSSLAGACMHAHPYIVCTYGTCTLHGKAGKACISAFASLAGARAWYVECRMIDRAVPNVHVCTHRA